MHVLALCLLFLLYVYVYSNTLFTPSNSESKFYKKFHKIKNLLYFLQRKLYFLLSFNTKFNFDSQQSLENCNVFEISFQYASNVA